MRWNQHDITDPDYQLYRKDSLCHLEMFFIIETVDSYEGDEMIIGQNLLAGKS